MGDSKWLWSIFGFVVNWKRPIASGPFTREQVNEPGVHVPVVYDRQFYRDVFRQYVNLLTKSKEVVSNQVLVPYPTDGPNLDPRRQQQQFEKFCETELGFRVQDINNFAVHFGWEGAWVGPLHVVGTATKNTYSQWLQIFYLLGRSHSRTHSYILMRAIAHTYIRTLGLKDKFEEYLHNYKIDVRTVVRSTRGGEKLVSAAVWSDAGDLIDAVTKGRVFPIKHPDTMSDGDLRVSVVCMNNVQT